VDLKTAINMSFGPESGCNT